MGIVYPNGIDTFTTPSAPEYTSLSEAGDSNRNHDESHEDLGKAVMALETNAAQLTHDHSGTLASVAVVHTSPGTPAVNDTQTITVTGSPTGGTFVLYLEGYGTTVGLDHDASAVAVQAALVTLVGSGNVAVAGADGGPYTVIFAGTLASAAQPLLAGNGTSLTPSGAVNTVHTLTGSAGSNDVQTITLTGDPTGGNFTLSLGAYTTGPIAYNAVAADVQTALTGLSSVGPGNATVTGNAGGPYTVTFTGTLGNAAVATLVVVNNLTGGLFATQQLLQVNTHKQADTDGSPLSIHHTIGLGAAQAAAGNHAHDYEGPSIFNKPMVICTSSTRPVDPYPGLVIWETDTNCCRVFAAFPGNTYVVPTGTGTSYTYNFNTANNAHALDPTVFDVTYVVGNPAVGGYMGAPSSGNCIWARSADSNQTCRAIARAVMPTYATTDEDNQAVSFTTGSHTMDIDMEVVRFKKNVYTHPAHGVSPTNDIYLRMSADKQSYVRFAIGNIGVGILYTTTGYTGETSLGGINAVTNHTNTVWTAKAIGSTYVLYANNVQVIAACDYQGLVNTGDDYRGWGIGMTAAAYIGNEPPIQQAIPNSIKSVTLNVQPYYATTFLWQLTSLGATPVFRAETRAEQEVKVGIRHHCWFTHCPEDWFGWLWARHGGRRYIMDIESSNTDMVINEPGHYRIKASLPWHPQKTFQDQSMIAIEVNGQDIGKKKWQFLRGHTYIPGFAQTQEIEVFWYLALGDTVRIVTQHNASQSCWTWWNDDYAGHNAQICHVELDFIKP